MALAKTATMTVKHMKESVMKRGGMISKDTSKIKLIEWTMTDCYYFTLNADKKTSSIDDDNDLNCFQKNTLEFQLEFKKKRNLRSGKAQSLIWIQLNSFKKF